MCIVEEKTRNVSIINYFARRMASTFPTAVSFVAFALLADGLGEMDVEVVIETLESLDVVYRRTIPYSFQNPLHMVRCALRIEDCVFPAAGHYQVSLRVDQELIAQRKLTLTLKGY